MPRSFFFPPKPVFLNFPLAFPTFCSSSIAWHHPQGLPLFFILLVAHLFPLYFPFRWNPTVPCPNWCPHLVVPALAQPPDLSLNLILSVMNLILLKKKKDWSRISLQCCVSFCYTMKWVTCVCVCVCVCISTPSHSHPRSLPCRSSEGMELSSLCYIEASH